jgi:single-strand DNA-binding protein
MIECAFFGSLVRDAEVKMSSRGKTYLRTNIRVENGQNALFISSRIFDSDAIASADKLVKGARVYIEGKLSLDEWTAQDGTKKSGLSVMSFHCRLSQIGRHKPPKSKQDFPRDMHSPVGNGAAGRNDDIPFAAEFR